jgi:ectoine hydroxylase-related dioxygenase (phytanoyl-CoA dioxygenase family)
MPVNELNLEKASMLKDLSLQHYPGSDLFTQPVTREQWEQYRLSDEQVAHFNRYGFLSGIPLLDEEQVGKMREELAAIADPAHPGHHLFYEFHSNESTDPSTILFHALGAWRISTALHDVLWNPRFVVAASQLLGNKAVRFWHDQVFWKPPRQGGVVAWHQDYSYWIRTRPVNHLTCWCALDDATIENGCLQYIPGSHTWGLLPKPAIAGQLDGIREFLNDEQQQAFEHPSFAEVKAGEAVFHHPLTLHGSGANTSVRPRRAFVLNVVGDGVVSDSNDPLLDGVPVVPKGSKLDGQFFPLLYDPGN